MAKLPAGPPILSAMGGRWPGRRRPPQKDEIMEEFLASVLVDLVAALLLRLLFGGIIQPRYA